MSSQINRRMFLRGAGGAALAIPFLPSLTTRAFCQEPPLPPVGRNFLAICMDHGNVWGANQYPSDALLTQTLSYAGRDVRYGALPTQANESGRIHWSPAYSASADRLAPIANKFNIMKGLDIPFRIGHNLGGHLGNFADLDGLSFAGFSSKAYMTRTIDQVMAYSDSVYTEHDRLSRLTHRSFHIGRGVHAHNFTNLHNRTGKLVLQPAHRDNVPLYEHLFEPGSFYNGVDQTILNYVKEGYDQLRRHPRLSRGDKDRLDQHVARVSEIEQKLVVAQELAAPPKPEGVENDSRSSKVRNHELNHNPGYQIKYCELMADMIVMAFSTGTSRVATWDPYETRFTYDTINDWHGKVAHQSGGRDAAQAWMVGYNQGVFEHIMVAVAHKLNETPAADGQTMLDHSLIMLTNEAGQQTHHTNCVNYPLITAGGAGGYFNTGHFVDFSDQAVVYNDLDYLIESNPNFHRESPGLYYQQWLGNALMAMGVPRTDYEEFAEITVDGPERSERTGGYGHYHIDAGRAADYAQAKLVMDDPLPVITHG